MTFPRVGAVRACLLALAIAALPLAGAAQWRVTKDRPFGVVTTIEIAVVKNDDGHVLRVYRDDDSIIRGIFRLREGLATLAEDSCPTYLVDDNPPVALSLEGGPCRLDARQAQFSLGQVDETEIRSTSLLALMNGSALRFRFHLRGLGYQETKFSLRRSKQALNAAIGQRIKVIEE